MESDGVIVFRPWKAWKDKDHFLHRTVQSFKLEDQNMIGALTALYGASMGGSMTPREEFAATTADGARRFSVALEATTVLDAFNAVVREHKALGWEIE